MDVRASYAHIYEPKAGTDQNGNPTKPSFSITGLGDKKTHKEVVQALAASRDRLLAAGTDKQGKPRRIKKENFFPDEVTRYVVEIYWTGANLDRPNTYGISCGSNHKLALRLATAVDAQVVFLNPRIVRDVNDKSYVEAECRVMGRHLNRDLQRLGF